MNIELRSPSIVMKLSRLGSFHQSKLSFLRSFLKEFKDWEYKRDLFELNELGHGVAVYSFKKDKRVYSLIYTFVKIVPIISQNSINFIFIKTNFLQTNF